MNKITFLYRSVHHKNTEKVVNYISKKFQDKIQVVNIANNKIENIPNSDYIILASGIYYGTLHKDILNYIDTFDFTGKKVIVLYTYGIKYKNYGSSIKKKLKKKNAHYIGSCSCKGYDTYGFLKKIGGVAKQHPNNEDCERIFSEISSLIRAN